MDDRFSDLLERLREQLATDARRDEVEAYLSSEGLDRRQIGEILAALFDDRTGQPAERGSSPARVLRGLESLDRGIPRAHMPVLDLAGEVAGEVTSGTFSPSLNLGLGMGFVDAAAFPKDSTSPLAIRIHDKNVAAEAAAMPFYKKS